MISLDTPSHADFGLRVQPMVHVDDMARAIGFYETIGGTVVFGSRDGDWALMQFGDSTLSLLAHPPGDGKRETVELQFTTSASLHDIEAHVKRSDPAMIERGTADEAFGRMLILRTTDGLLVKILELERDVIE
jgi:catechol 2,3-dioxygenase-like lactoylglutathione lyase family enzyme